MGGSMKTPANFSDFKGNQETEFTLNIDYCGS